MTRMHIELNIVETHKLMLKITLGIIVLIIINL